MKSKIALNPKQFKRDEEMLEYDTHWYETKIMFNEKEIAYSIEMGTDQKLTEFLKKAERELEWLQNASCLIEGEIKNSDLIQTKNEYWLEEGEEAVTKESFIQKIDLLSIHSCVEEGELSELSLEYDDGGIFGGHRILVELENREVISIAF